MKRIFYHAKNLSLILLLVCCNLNVAGETVDSKPNVLFIAIEDFNPEHFGCYGGKAITPNIDAIAQEGVIFKNAFCQAPVCNPSRTALLTGLRPHSSGVFGNADNWQEMALPKIKATMPQHFKNNGYEAVKVGKIFHYQMEHPESWSRELPEQIEGRKLLSAWHADVVPTLKALEPVEGGGWFADNLHWGPYDCEPGEFRDGHSATSASRFLAEQHEKPFFLAIGFHAPHVKFSAPKQFFDLYDVNEIEIPENPPNDLDDVPTIDGKYVIHEVMDSSEWRDIKRAQFACISYVDWCIGEVMQALKNNNLDKNTVIAIWTDHGFMLGEHFQWSKGGNKLFREDNNVGFIWKVPGVTPKGAISTRVVETIDIFPTFFELCSIPIPETSEGESLVPLLKNPSLTWDKAAYTWGTSKRVSIQTERYILNTNINLDPKLFELYDHKYDPNEFINVSCNPQYQHVIDSLIAMYKNHSKKYSINNNY